MVNINSLHFSGDNKANIELIRTAVNNFQDVKTNMNMSEQLFNLQL